MEKLELGVAYHGNRMLGHIKDDMLDIVKHNMNLVVHMFTHNDMVRHRKVMKDIFAVTREAGLDFWVDNWGLGGRPGDPCHFAGYAPESRKVKSDGEIDPIGICLSNRAFVQFTKDWIDAVGEAGGKKLFWDEPHYHTYEDDIYVCCCDNCKAHFYDMFGYEMPLRINDDVRKHHIAIMTDYFREVTEYSHKNGMENICCLMPSSRIFLESMVELPYIDNIGTDPYWSIRKNPYLYAYESTKEYVNILSSKGKKTHTWIQAYGGDSYRFPEGWEDEIYLATDAAYDAGARTILAWSYRGGEACDYRANHTDLTWHVTGEAMRRVKDRFLDEQRAAYLKEVK